ncbi:MAG: FHIPEP family type III secretion protein, partial [Deltaproteobacteria bacterium]|nr:FHIPEP family type III secretion protein [Deltaproteobacteria bacterium]
LVTRLRQGGNVSQLGSQIAMQIFSEPLALLATAAMMLLLSIVPGLPFWPFLIMAGLLGVSYLTASKILSGNQNLEPGKSLSHDKFLITLDRLQELLDTCAKENPVLVRESVYGRVQLPFLADILTEMKLDGVDESYLVQILEALSREEITDDLDDMLIRIRLRLGATINDISKHTGGLKIIEVDSITEDLLLENCIKTARGKELILNTDVTNSVIEQINHSLSKSKTTSLLTGTFTRRPLARLIQSHIPQISVFAKGELTDYSKIDIVDSLSIDI